MSYSNLKVRSTSPLTPSKLFKADKAAGQIGTNQTTSVLKEAPPGVSKMSLRVQAKDKIPKGSLNSLGHELPKAQLGSGDQEDWIVINAAEKLTERHQANCRAVGQSSASEAYKVEPLSTDKNFLPLLSDERKSEASDNYFVCVRNYGVIEEDLDAEGDAELDMTDSGELVDLPDKDEAKLHKAPDNIVMATPMNKDVFVKEKEPYGLKGAQPTGSHTTAHQRFGRLANATIQAMLGVDAELVVEFKNGIPASEYSKSLRSGEGKQSVLRNSHDGPQKSEVEKLRAQNAQLNFRAHMETVRHRSNDAATTPKELKAATVELAHPEPLRSQPVLDSIGRPITPEEERAKKFSTLRPGYGYDNPMGLSTDHPRSPFNRARLWERSVRAGGHSGQGSPYAFGFTRWTRVDKGEEKGEE